MAGVIPALLIFTSAMVFATVWWIASRFGVELKTLTRDAATSNGGAFYGGYLSNFGMVLWGVASSVCAFTACLLYRAGAESRFILATGALTLMLYLDDFFLIHDGLAPVTIHRGDKTLFLLYGLFALTWLWSFRRTIRSTHYLSLALSIFFFATALIFDIEIFEIPGQVHYVFEDGFKLLGIAAWTGYVLPVCWHAMVSQMRGVN